jgi:hypothetical protein
VPDRTAALPVFVNENNFSAREVFPVLEISGSETMESKNYTAKRFFQIALTAALLLAAVAAAEAAIRPGVTYQKGNLTLEAKKATVGEILEAIARTAGVDVFIAKGFQPKADALTVKIEGEPLEDALKRILSGYSYAAIYEKEGDDFRIAALKIYPEGGVSGAVVPLFSGGRAPLYEEKTRRGETVTVLVDARGGLTTNGSALLLRGAVGPSETELTADQVALPDLNSPWFALQLRNEQEETRRFADLLMLRRNAELAVDPKLKQAMAMAYADDVAKFQLFKKANLNKVESLKRISLLQELNEQ